jgi:protein PhnA
MEITCPSCSSLNHYPDREFFVCLDCGNEWNPKAPEKSLADEGPDQLIKDANGNTLQDGDSVTLIKELKVKGGTGPLKVGTKVKNIKLIDAHDGHNISCKIEGVGSLYLKSEFVKKI